MNSRPVYSLFYVRSGVNVDNRKSAGKRGEPVVFSGSVGKAKATCRFGSNEWKDGA